MTRAAGEHAVGAVARDQPAREWAADEGHRGARQHEQRSLQRERPSTSRRRWLRTSAMPMMQKAEASAVRTAIVKPRSRNRLKSISRVTLARCRHSEPGEGAGTEHRRRCRGRQGGRPGQSPRSHRRGQQARSGSAATPADPSSSRSPASEGMRVRAATSANTTTGTLIRKTEPHQKYFEQHAADQRPDGRAARGDCAPHADCQGAFLLVAEGQSNDRQRGRHHRGCADRQSARAPMSATGER